MKEYKIVKSRWRFIDTEVILNSLANEGWKVVHTFNTIYFLLEREKKK